MGKKSRIVTGPDVDPNEVRIEAVSYSSTHREIHVDNLVESPLNPRTIRGPGEEAKLAELADSIRRLGVLDHLLIRENTDGQMEVLGGGRRWRASIVAAEKMPARAMVPCTVYGPDLPDDIAVEIAIANNDQREDPHPLDQCDAFVRLRDKHGRSVEQIAARCGRSAQYVYDRLRLEQLTPTSRDALLTDKITLGVALIVARIGSPTSQDRSLSDLLKRFPEGVPVQAARDAAKMRLMVIADAPFDVKDRKLTSAPACGDCPNRSDAQAHLFGDLLEDTQARCGLPECWEEKRAASWEQHAVEARELGKRVADEAEQKKIVPNAWGDLGAGYARLDDRSLAAGGEKTWRELLGKKAKGVEIVVVQDVNGAPVDVAKRTELEAALSPKATKSEPTNAIDHELEAEIEAEAGALLLRAIATKAQHSKYATAKFWRAFAITAVRLVESLGRFHLTEGALERRTFPGFTKTSENKEKNVDELLVELIGRMTPGQAWATAVELVVGIAPGVTSPPIIAALSLEPKALRRDAAKTVRARRKAEAADAKKSKQKIPRKVRKQLEAAAESGDKTAAAALEATS